MWWKKSWWNIFGLELQYNRKPSNVMEQNEKSTNKTNTGVTKNGICGCCSMFVDENRHSMTSHLQIYPQQQQQK